MKHDAILFDLDGTLWDSTIEVAHSWQKIVAQTPGLVHNPTVEDYLSVMGLSDVDLMKKLFPELNETQGRALFERCCIEENAYLAEHGAKAYEGVSTLLETLSKDYKLAVVSNCGLGYIETYFKAMGTGKYFSDHLCFAETRRPKGENIRTVVARGGFKRPLYVGDTLWDQKAAASAGVPFVFAAYGFGKVSDDTPRIHTPLELLTYLNEND